jgi:hypothetical protein
MSRRVREQLETPSLRSRESHDPPARAVGPRVPGALALAAIAVGALAIGALAIGRLAIGRARIRRVEIDELVVGKLRVTEELQLPPPRHSDSQA